MAPALAGYIVFETLIVLSHLHGVDKLDEGGKILFLLRGLIVDIPDKGGIKQRFGFLPEIVPALAIPLGVGNQGIHQLQNVLFRMDIRKRVIVHGLLEVDGIEHLDTVVVALQELSTFDEDAAFSVSLSRTECGDFRKKLLSVHISPDKPLDFVAHGFLARFAEMERYLIGGAADGLYKVGLDSQRGSGCGGAAVGFSGAVFSCHISSFQR